MTRLLARALIEELPHGEELDPRRGVDRVLLGTFWRPTPTVLPAPVLSITSLRAASQKPSTRR